MNTVYRTAKLPVEMELTTRPSGDDIHVKEAECDYSDVHTKMAKMIELKQHLFSQAEENIKSAQARYKKDYDRNPRYIMLFIYLRRSLLCTATTFLYCTYHCFYVQPLPKGTLVLLRNSMQARHQEGRQDETQMEWAICNRGSLRERT